MSGTRRVLSATGEVAHELLQLTAAAVDVFPPLKDAAGMALRIADLVKHFRSNRDQWRELGAYVQDATASIVQSLAQVHGSNGETKSNVEKLKTTLDQVERRTGSEKALPWHKRATRFLDDSQMIEDMRKQIDDQIGLFKLSATIITMVNVEKTLDAVIANEKALSDIAQNTSTIMAQTESISHKASQLGLNATLDRLPRVPGASWDPARCCMEGTRVELVDNVMEWAGGPTVSNHATESGGASVVLLTAVAGAGKSTVAHTVARKCHERGLLGSSFFFDRETDGRNSAAGLFTTVAADLSRMNADIAVCVAAAVEEDRSLLSAPLSRQFDELVLKPCLRSSILSPLVVVIDALDEAWSEDLLDILRDRASLLPAPIRIFLTSRMRPELSSLLQEAHVSKVELNIVAASNVKDISVYAPSKLQQLARKRILGDDWPGEQLQKQFTDKADGLFLWVATVCDYLYRRNDPTRELEQIVSATYLSANSAEDKMNRLYATILESFDWTDSGFAASYRRVMGAAIVTKTPLTISALEEIYRERPLALDFTLQRLSPLLTGMNRSDRRGQPVRVLHQSLRDFLSNSTEFTIVEEEHNLELAVLCLELINRDLNETTPGTGYLEQGTATNPGIPVVNLDGFPEALRYACLFWREHAEDCNWAGEMRQALRLFLDQKVVLWMEVVAVCGRYTGLNKLQGPVKDDEAWTLERKQRFANASMSLFHRLRFEDRREEALEAVKEAVVIHRQLAIDQATAHTYDLADSLVGLSVGLSDLGDHEGALAADEEAIPLFRLLSAENPDNFTSNLANALNNLSVDLGSASRHDEALAAIQEAVKLHRQLAADLPAAFTPALAGTLNNLSIRLSDFGRHGEALAAIEEAVQLRRQLAADQPAAFTPDLAQSLNNLSVRLSDFGRHGEALAAIEEAVQLYRQLAADRPAAFTPDLAQSLNSLSVRLSDFGRHEEALAAIEEAVQLYRQLAADRPAASTPKLAESLNNLSACLSNWGRHEEALTAIEEAVQLRQQLAAVRPAAFTPDLAQSFNNLSIRLSDFGRYDEALAAIEETVQLYRQLAADRPAAFTPDLAQSLNNLSTSLSDWGRHEEALAAIEEAVQLRRQLAEDRPAAFTPDLAVSLNNLSYYLNKLGRHEEALAPIQEAIGLRRKLAADRPAVFTSDLADSLGNLSHYLSMLGRHEEALPAIREAIPLYRRLAADRPLVFNASLRRNLRNYSIRLREAGHLEEAEVIDAEIAGLPS